MQRTHQGHSVSFAPLTQKTVNRRRVMFTYFSVHGNGIVLFCADKNKKKKYFYFWRYSFYLK
jgi:hypothetical protein